MCFCSQLVIFNDGSQAARLDVRERSATHQTKKTWLAGNRSFIRVAERRRKADRAFDP